MMIYRTDAGGATHELPRLAARTVCGVSRGLEDTAGWSPCRTVNSRRARDRRRRLWLAGHRRLWNRYRHDETSMVRPWNRQRAQRSRRAITSEHVVNDDEWG